MVVLLPIPKIRIRNRAAFEIWFVLVKRDQLIRFEKGEGAEQYSVDHAENHCVGADTESQSEDRHGSKAAVAPHLPQCVTNIL